MKEVKINFCGFWNSFDYKSSLFYNILIKHYNVIISDTPDYIICSCFGSPRQADDPYGYLKYNGVRIMFSGENYIPDFNLVDYGISLYPLQLSDRHFWFPHTSPPYVGVFKDLSSSRNFTKEDIKNKPFFATMLASHDSEYNLRSKFFYELSKYKPIASAGRLCYNLSQPVRVSRDDESKKQFLQLGKFHICFESTQQYGFMTEKLTEGFAGNTIPIYLGSQTSKDIFDENSFIYIANSDDFNKAIEKIIELDQNDDKYLEMLNRQPLKDNQMFEKIMFEYEQFICHIFDQPLEKAYRRNKTAWPAKHEAFIKAVKGIK